ncbi:MAG TPA: aspartate ammonia-lyase [Lachnospiraceae bacterium]|nr:aspartate ammonia-lyase [Lachnospiraceae bacterium]
MRTEKDFLGEIRLEDGVYYGSATARAVSNFRASGIPADREIILAVTEVKKAAAITNRDAGFLEQKKADAIIAACDEVLGGAFADQFVTDALQGGAGTSLNMNVNEVLANRAIELLGGQKGDYSLVHPLDDVNLHQSTNDVFPTALRIAAIRRLKCVSEGFADLQTALQEKEKEFSSVLKIGRTEMQDAVPVTLGQEFGAWAQAVSRDRWRLYKAEERLRLVNIGGTAVGTGIDAPREYIFNVIENLRNLTGIGLARADYMMDPTQNCDVFCEVTGLLKASAVTLAKICGDLRLLSSGPRGGIREISLPALQQGSSIMPGKVNPVMTEMVTQAAYEIMADDLAVTLASQAGQLELNAFLPLIARHLMNSLGLLSNILPAFAGKCIRGIRADEEGIRRNLAAGTAFATALTPKIGYDKAAEIAKESLATGRSIRDLVLTRGLMDEESLNAMLNPEYITSPHD